MTYDPIFPLPEPDFLWVHDLVVHPQSGASVSTDAEGNWKYVDTSASIGFVGYIAAPNPREFDRAAARGISLDAVALAPRGVAVDESDRLDAPAAATYGSAGVPPLLVGEYLINAVRPNASHTRLLLTRWKHEAKAPHAP